jgi:protocatechuate 3,4-dioxygenase beta subunit
VSLKTKKDNSFVAGTITNEEGRFSFAGIKSGTYLMQATYSNFITITRKLFGNIEPFS